MDTMTLELALIVLAVVAALRLITAISFSAGRKAGRKAVFAAYEAVDVARGEARAADAAAASARTWLRDRKRESDKVEQNWQAFTYEHRSYVSEQLAYAEAGLERTQRAQVEANLALESARQAVEGLK